MTSQLARFGWLPDARNARGSWQADDRGATSAGQHPQTGDTLGQICWVTPRLRADGQQASVGFTQEHIARKAPKGTAPPVRL
jgi:hypothetical protein